MPKSLPILPEIVRRQSEISFSPIPINQYQRTFSDEVSRFTPLELVGIYHDMCLIRAFETMLSEIKLNGGYRGIEYNHRGPAHLSIGQEAMAVGQAFHLGVDDFIFGSHRSHGEILAKGLSAIRKLDADPLEKIMAEYLDGDISNALTKTKGRIGANAEVQLNAGFELQIKSQGVDFLIYGALAEIFGKMTGFNRGMGGSMHAFFTPFGIYPNNAIVGGSADLATGAALFKRVNRTSGIVIANIGDASASCGPVWEALCFASMDQFTTLWDEAHQGGLPVLFNFVNNFYGMGGQPVGETGGFQTLARIGAGLNHEQLHAERIDGLNPFAVIDASKRKKEALLDGKGPALLDTITYRISGHSPSDASSYREKSEIEAWQKQDSLLTMRRNLLDFGIANGSELENLERVINLRLLECFKTAIDLESSPRANLHEVGNLLERTMFSNQKVESFDHSRLPELIQSPNENSRVKQLASKSRSGVDLNGLILPKSKCIGIRDALFEAILHRFTLDSTLIAYGEENRDWGGAFAVYRGLTELLPYHRLFNSPIAEAAIVGTAVGYAISGGRALVELMYCDFLGRAGDEVFNQLAKWQSMSGGTLRMPVVVRVSVGSKYGAQHSQDWTALCAHIPGLKVVFPATPYDAKGLMNSALSGTDPVIFFESQRIYDQSEHFHGAQGVPAGYYEIPIGEPEVKREGSDLTILTVGATLYRALNAARTLDHDYGVSAEVIDARSIVPFNYETLIESVKKTGRLLLCSDACERGSVLQTMAQCVANLAFDYLDCPPIILGARNWITPPDEVEDAFFPFETDIIDVIHQRLHPLANYQPFKKTDVHEQLRRHRLGI